jgi:tetratricopeptide (TPR) repeat protein
VQQRLLILFFALSVLLVGLRAETVLVLPFSNQSSSSNLDWIGESIADTMQESLAAEGVLALDRDDRLEAFRRLSLRTNAVLTRASMIKAGESLDASEIVYGEYGLAPPPPGAPAASRGILCITARVLNLRRFQQGPEFGENGPLDDLAALEKRLSWQALVYISPKTAPSEQDFLRTRPHVRLDAMESYIRGLLADNTEQQRKLFMQAAHLDENYSQPCFQLGKSYWRKKDYRSAGDWLARVNSSDPHYLEAQFFLGLCKYHNGDFAAAEKCFGIVAQTVPLNEVYNNLGAAQVRGNPAAAAGSFRKALDGDTTDLDYQFNLGYALWRSGQYPEAAASFRAVLESNPNDDEAAQLLGRAERREPPRPGAVARERLKTNYEETAFRQLKAELESKRDGTVPK